jgi:hypothetical protein
MSQNSEIGVTALMEDKEIQKLLSIYFNHRRILLNYNANPEFTCQQSTKAVGYQLVQPSNLPPPSKFIRRSNANHVPPPGPIDITHICPSPIAAVHFKPTSSYDMMLESLLR